VCCASIGRSAINVQTVNYKLSPIIDILDYRPIHSQSPHLTDHISPVEMWSTLRNKNVKILYDCENRWLKKLLRINYKIYRTVSDNCRYKRNSMFFKHNEKRIKGAFTHKRGEPNFASPRPPSERRDEATFASPRLYAYGTASTSGTTIIQSYTKR